MWIKCSVYENAIKATLLSFYQNKLQNNLYYVYLRFTTGINTIHVENQYWPVLNITSVQASTGLILFFRASWANSSFSVPGLKMILLG